MKALVIKRVWQWFKDIYRDQWNRIKDSEKKQHVYNQFIFIYLFF